MVKLYLERLNLILKPENIKHKKSYYRRSSYIVGITLPTETMKLDQELAADHVVLTFWQLRKHMYTRGKK